MIDEYVGKATLDMSLRVARAYRTGIFVSFGNASGGAGLPAAAPSPSRASCAGPSSWTTRNREELLPLERDHGLAPVRPAQGARWTSLPLDQAAEGHKYAERRVDGQVAALHIDWRRADIAQRKARLLLVALVGRSNDKPRSRNAPTRAGGPADACSFGDLARATTRPKLGCSPCSFVMSRRSAWKDAL